MFFGQYQLHQHGQEMGTGHLVDKMHTSNIFVKKFPFDGPIDQDRLTAFLSFRPVSNHKSSHIVQKVYFVLVAGIIEHALLSRALMSYIATTCFP